MEKKYYIPFSNAKSLWYQTLQQSFFFPIPTASSSYRAGSFILFQTPQKISPNIRFYFILTTFQLQTTYHSASISIHIKKNLMSKKRANGSHFVSFPWLWRHNALFLLISVAEGPRSATFADRCDFLLWRFVTSAK